LKAAILYNIPGEGSARSGAEMEAELEVLETVAGVKEGLEMAGHEAVALRCSLETLFSLKSFDLVINLAEGFADDLSAEPKVAGFLELLGVPFTGSCASALELGRDKGLSKLVLDREGIPTPRFQIFRSADEAPSLDRSVLEYPVIIKPVLEDASIGITVDSIARDGVDLMDKVRRIIETYRQPAIVEEYIDGREVNAALIIGPGGAELLPISEIVFDLPEGTPRILGFEAKWVEDSPFYQRTVPLCPAPLPEELRDRIEELARRACAALGVEGYARVDFRIREVDAEPFVIEVNPNPCINPMGSGFARAAAAAGIDYPELVKKIASAALDRWGKGRIWETPEPPPEVFVWRTLAFRRVGAEDGPLLFGWFEDRELTRYMEPSTSLTIDQLEASILCSKDEDYVVMKGDRPIGFASIYERTCCTCEISYLIGDPDYRGLGLGNVIVEALLEEAFRRLGVRTVYASATVENISSIRALEAAGFRRIGTRRASSMMGEECLDDLLFDITREEYLSGRSSVD
jgi:D-alanine-D-alanine ligase